MPHSPNEPAGIPVTPETPNAPLVAEDLLARADRLHAHGGDPVEVAALRAEAAWLAGW